MEEGLYGGADVCNTNGDYNPGLGSMACHYGCLGSIRTLSYTCTDFSVTENWQYGGDSFSYTFPITVENKFTIGFTGCCWTTMVIGIYPLLFLLQQELILVK